MIRKHGLWLIAASLVTLSLIISCAPAAPQAPAPSTPVAPAAPAPSAPTQEKPQQEPAAASAEKPVYGGTITYRIASDPTNFDSASRPSGGALINTVYEQFMNTDWLRGPAGSGVTDFAAGGSSMEDWFGPQLAESWEMPEKGVWILNIRPGVYWQPVDSAAGKLMGGREVTVDDIVAGFNYLLNRDPKAPAPNSWIFVGTAAQVAKTATIAKSGERQVTIRTPQEFMTSWVYLIQGAGFYRVYPPDVIHKYGSVADWRNAVGTGPYMLVDYVPGSQFLFKKNPIYWDKDPVGPGKGNQLPYADNVRELIIPDLSTTYAALRTGKLDLEFGVPLTDAQTLWKNTPELKSVKYQTGMYGIGMAQDKKDKPYSDIKVRKALMLATDFEAIKRDYYSGEAEIINWPANPPLVFYEPMEQLPESIQELYRYNPDKAKQLLAEAGYPNGFKASIIVQSASERIDEMSVIKGMWAKVGVELTLDIKEPGAYATFVGAGVPHNDLLYRVFPGSYFNMHLYDGFIRGAAILNISHVNSPPGTDPYMEGLFNEKDKYLFIDMPRVYEAVKKSNRYVMEQAFVIPWPVPNRYNLWWPWVKNYYGQGTAFIRYSWVDQNLKKSMGY